MSAFSVAWERLRYDLRRFAGTSPLLYFTYVRLRRPVGYRHIVDANKDLLIEGFPRSGNTFAKQAFCFAQSGSVNVAHHLHVPAQVIEAVRLDVPAVLLVRQPKDAVVAFGLMNPNLHLGQILKSYLRYHRCLLPYLDRIVVATFEQATTDFGAVIRSINEKYNTCFVEFQHSEENQAEVFARLTSNAYQRIPNRTNIGTIPDRQADREERRAQLAEAYDRIRGGRAPREANELYQRVIAFAKP